MAQPVLVPLLTRSGTVRAHALVSAPDAERVLEHVWRLHATGYAFRGRKVEGVYQAIYLHRAVLGCEPGDGREVDHVNRDKLDCRRANLRLVTHAENLQNLAPQEGRTSAHRGVYWHRAAGKWAAAITVGGKRLNLGLFTDEMDAAQAAHDARLEHMSHA